MLVKPARITFKAPECLRVFNNKIAPKIIHKIENVTPKPSNVEAKILLSGIPQAKNAMMNDTTNTIGIALFAGHLKPTSNIPAKRIGKKAKRAWIDKLILKYLLVNINSYSNGSFGKDLKDSFTGNLLRSPIHNAHLQKVNIHKRAYKYNKINKNYSIP